MFTNLDATLPADAFPQALRADAIQAAEPLLRRLHQKQWTERFEVRVEGETVQLPARFNASQVGVFGALADPHDAPVAHLEEP